MQGMHIRMLRWLKTGTFVRILVLLMVLSLLAGCATDGKIKPDLVVQEPSVAKNFSVERLEDGREGFIIKEVSSRYIVNCRMTRSGYIQILAL